MSESSAVVDVVCAHNRARQFLDEIVLLVCTFCRRQEGNAIRSIAITDFTQPGGDVLQSVLPVRTAKGLVAAIAHERPAETVWRMDEVKTESTFDTEVSKVDFVVEAPVAAKNHSILDVKVNLASNATVGTGRMNDAVGS
jgi:hypothetical protein